MYCQNCGNQLPDEASFCDKCGMRVGGLSDGYSPNSGMASIMINKKSEGLALILSFLIPGLGQIYVGKSSAGALMIVAAVILGMTTALLILPGIIYIALWIYGMYNAYVEAKEYNRYLLDHNGNPPW